jgi:AraC-like DNA-binding protein
MDLPEFVIPGMFPITWLAYAADNGLPVDELIANAGLRAEHAASFANGVSVKKLVVLIRDVLLRVGDNGIGFEIGWRLPVTAYGNIGHAMLASATLGDALELCQRFWPLMARGIRLNAAAHEDVCVLTLSPLLAIEEPFRHILTELALASVYRGIVGLVPQAEDVVEVWFDVPEPAYADGIRRRVRHVRFAQPMPQVRAPAALLDTPLAMASAAGSIMAIRQCEAEEAALHRQGRVIEDVRKRLIGTEAGYPSLEHMAGMLNLSPRTFRRHLAAEGTGYAHLLETARRRDALRLLENPSLKVVDVSERLGYADPANFIRAFRRWSGMTPRQYRQALHGAEPT